MQALWALLVAYHAAEAVVAAALADPAAAKAAVPKKQQASKDIVDPEDWLPGPSKYLLDATLRAICSLLKATESDMHPQQGPDVDSSHNVTAAMHSWVTEQDAGLLVCLLRHPSARVQVSTTACTCPWSAH